MWNDMHPQGLDCRPEVHIRPRSRKHHNLGNRCFRLTSCSAEVLLDWSRNQLFVSSTKQPFPALQFELNLTSYWSSQRRWLSCVFQWLRRDAALSIESQTVGLVSGWNNTCQSDLSRDPSLIDDCARCHCKILFLSWTRGSSWKSLTSTQGLDFDCTARSHAPLSAIRFCACEPHGIHCRRMSSLKSILV